MAGKGDKFRPVNKEVYDKNFEAVFGQKKLNIMSDDDRQDLAEQTEEFAQFEKDHLGVITDNG